MQEKPYSLVPDVVPYLPLVPRSSSPTCPAIYVRKRLPATHETTQRINYTTTKPRPAA